jgi:hypothetical protein
MSKFTQWIKICEFLRFSEGEVERLRCSQANSSLNPSIIFGLKTCKFTLSISHDRRGSRLFIEWGIMNLSDYSEGEGESLRCRWVNSPSNPSILFCIRAYISPVLSCLQEDRSAFIYWMEKCEFPSFSFPLLKSKKFILFYSINKW